MHQQGNSSETLEVILDRITKNISKEQVQTGPKSQNISKTESDNKKKPEQNKPKLQITNACSPDLCFYAGRTYSDIFYLCKKKDFSCPPLAYALKKQLVKCGIYERYHWATFENIEKRGIPDKQSFSKVLSYVENLEKNLKNGDGLILKGGVGTGKTTLAAAVVQHMIRNGNTSCYFVPLASLLDEIFSRKGDDQKEYMHQLKNCRLLVIDDLGQEHDEGWVQLKFENVISERYNRCRSTIFTSNLSNEQMKGRYTERIIDRFRDNSDIINFTGRSLRGQLRAV